jgi:hypothetical protein
MSPVPKYITQNVISTCIILKYHMKLRLYMALNIIIKLSFQMQNNITDNITNLQYKVMKLLRF